ncbi:MAG TPA: cysteine desulfurase family protein, partial [Longimicrobiales bacterium]
ALGAKRSEIVFTSGGTEADNLAVLGRARAATTGEQRAVIVCSAVEHKAVLSAVKAAAHDFATAIIVAVDSNGVIDLHALRQALLERPAVVAVMWVNNEVGTIQPVREIADLCAEAGVPFHTDAIQAFGRVPVQLNDGITSLAVSGHKLGAPKGIGALFVRSGLAVTSTQFGGSQERGIRPGTENVAYAVGLSVAIELAAREQASEAVRLAALRDRLQQSLEANIPDLLVNAAGAARAPHILNVSLKGIEQDALLVSLDLEGIAVSTASACQSGAAEPSHVLVAMGRGTEDDAALRMSLGRTTTETEIEYVGTRLPAIVERIRNYAHA